MNPDYQLNRSMKRLATALLALMVLLCGSCSGINLPLPPSTTGETSTPTLDTPSQTSTSSGPGSIEASPTPGPVTLTIWLPPQFDPTSGTEAGELLQARLDEFSRRQSDVNIEVRIKAVQGPGGLLDSLTTASAAAPLALPDLVALPYDELQSAALKGLLHPYDGLTTTMDDPDWYPYAQQLAQVQNSTYGIPFAGDMLLMIYRAEVISEPPTDWPASLAVQAPLAFPAADLLAIFTLAQYRANGGEIQDEQGRPMLDSTSLSEVLTYFDQAAEVDLMPLWLTQFDNQGQAWGAYLEGRSDMVIAQATRYLDEELPDSALAHFPTPYGKPFTLANGWVWALASPVAEQREISTRLAEFLSESSFLSEWSLASGYLPPHPSSLTAGNWPDTLSPTILDQVSASAELLPTIDILSSLGAPLKNATVEVLKRQSDPLSAAEEAVNSLAEP